MKNFEKFKTAKERAIAFNKYCNSNSCQKCFDDCLSHSVPCLLKWLDIEAEEDMPLPCPFCGSKVNIEDTSTNSVNDGWCIECIKDDCLYSSGIKRTRDEAIAAHNRVAKAVIDAKESEAK